MKFTIKDKLGYKWAYDIDEQRFYLNDKEVEGELGEQNGYLCSPGEIKHLVIGHNSVADFSPENALRFCREIINLGF